MNVAVTLAAADMVTVQVPLPVHAPLHPANAEPEDAAAERVTALPALNDAEQVVPQSMPEGLEVIVPAPLPDFATESV